MPPFYDNTPGLVDDLPAAEPATPAVAEQPKTEEQIAAALHPEPKPFVEVPEAVAAWRAQHTPPEEHFYSNTADPTIEGEVRQALVAGPEGADDGRRVREVAIELTRIASDVGLDAEGISEYRSAVAEVAALDDAGRADLRAQAQGELQRAFGDKAAEALQAAQALVRRDPRVAQMLDATGAGDHPAIVLRLARSAMAQRANGRLK